MIGLAITSSSMGNIVGLVHGRRFSSAPGALRLFSFLLISIDFCVPRNLRTFLHLWHLRHLRVHKGERGL